jgi:hypothetical protein
VGENVGLSSGLDIVKRRLGFEDFPTVHKHSDRDLLK